MNDYENLYDLIIIGGGPAGLSAAIYAARAKERVLVIENQEFGGQIALTDKVMNYPGVAPCSGRELTDLMKEQAKSFGAKLIYANVHRMNLEGKTKKVFTSTGDYKALAVILATGALPKNAGFEGEDTFKGRGVAYCATCDGPLFAGCEIFVVGGGLAAVEEAIYLTQFTNQITLLVREDELTCAKSVADQLKLYAGIKVLYHTEIQKVSGDGMIDRVVLRDNHSGKVWEVKTDDSPYGVFVFVGYNPNTAELDEQLDRDEEGYLVTDQNCLTNLPGVAAAGDVRQKSLRQVVTAAADGATAAVALEAYIKEQHKKMNIPDLVKESSEIITQLSGKALLRVWLDDSKLAREMMEFLEEEADLRDKVDIEIHREGRVDLLLPSIEICRADGSSSGIHFHAVPKGLEWNSFQIALFNVIGPGQKVDEEVLAKIRSIKHKKNLKVLSTLTCSNCPTTVMSACVIAALNPNVTTEIFDVVHFKKMRYQYHLMSVPALVDDGQRLIKGKMDLAKMVDEILK